jgi:heptosyltransferase-2
MKKTPLNTPGGVPRRVLVRGANWVGDTVMTLPALREIRRILPESEITLWAPQGLVPLLDLAGIAKDFVPFGPNSAGKVRRPFVMGKRLSDKQFDLVVLLQNAFECAFTAWLARIPKRLGFSTDLRGPLLNLTVPMPRDIRKNHEVFYYLQITDYLDQLVSGAKTRQGTPDCSVEISPEVLEKSLALQAAHGLSANEPVFCLCPGSVNSEAKRWPAGFFAQLADILVERLGQVVFLGAPGERDLVDSIISGMSRKAVNLAGAADLRTSLGLMRGAKLVISNDTGSAHLAVAASAKVLTIFGPTIPGATAPYGPGAHIIQGAADCAPCRRFRCPKPEHPCMRSVAPAQVFAKIEEMLGL